MFFSLWRMNNFGKENDKYGGFLFMGIRFIPKKNVKSGYLLKQDLKTYDSWNVGSYIALFDERSDDDRRYDGAIYWAQQAKLALIELEKEIQAGMDVNALMKDGKTPLGYAVEKYWVECVRVLLQHGANVYQKDINGKTALELSSHPFDNEIENMIRAHIGLALVIPRNFNEWSK
jgi:ankyrin repeat protein